MGQSGMKKPLCAVLAAASLLAVAAPAFAGDDDAMKAKVSRRVDQVFAKFKEGVRAQVADSDSSTHYDLGVAYNKAVGAFGAAGCRYLQLDEVNIAYLCDPEQISMLKARGEHVENLLEIYAGMLNQAIAGKPEGMVISMHLCRGNFRSTWVASGGYEPVAEVLFNQINSDAYFMEYDTDRAGGFEPLRFVPRGPKIVVLGIMTSKTGELESKDELKRRIDEAAKYLPLEQLALSPQCGFASTEEGNTLTEDQQWAKLSRCVEVAQEVCARSGGAAVLQTMLERCDREGRVVRLNVLRGSRAQRLYERYPTRFVAHIRAVGQIVGTIFPHEQLVQVCSLITGAA